MIDDMLGLVAGKKPGGKVKIRCLFVTLILGLVATATIALLRLPRGELSPAYAQGPDDHGTYYVAPGGDCGAMVIPCYDSIQAAVDDVDEPGSVIKIAKGIYTDVHARAGITQVVYISKTISILGGYTITDWDTPDPETNVTTLDAQGRGRVLSIVGDVSPTIEGLRITGGDATGLGGHAIPSPLEGASDAGGGVYIITATVTIRNNHVFDNRAEYGGGLYLYASSATVSGNTVTTNTASFQGGGLFLYNQDDATLVDNLVTGNRVNGLISDLYVHNQSHRLLHPPVVYSSSSEISPTIRAGVYPDVSSLPAEDRLVLAFYYPWYGLFTWSRPEMLDTPLFPYASNDPVAISRHITWTQASGLDGLVVSWWGRNADFYDDGIFGQILDAMMGTNLRATIYLETVSPVFDSPSDIIDDLEYVLNTYGNHPSLLTQDGRPVVFLYAVEHVARGGAATRYEAWQTIVDTLYAGGYDPFFVADTLDPDYLDIFDGLHTYFALQDVPVYQDVSCQAHQAGKLWAANIYPGYDDRLLDWRPKHMYIPRNNGQVYSETFAAALQSDPDWIVVTSFNEWWENTHIEPSVMYGYEYLSRTAVLVDQFHAWRTLPIIHVDAAHTGPEDGSVTHPYNTLDEALVAADNGATLRLARGVYEGPIALARNITLEGGYDPISWTRTLTANSTIIQGNGNGPVVTVRLSPCAASPSVVLDRLTITGGAATGATPSGGGVRVEEGAQVLINNSVIASNQARDYGGGGFVEGNAQLMLQNVHVLSNTAGVGGGLAAGSQAKLWVTNTIIARNQASVAGGGLYSAPDASTSIVNSTLTGNDAQSSGTGLYAWPFPLQTVVITNSIVWGNGDGDLGCTENCAVTYSDVAGGWPDSGNLNADPLFLDPVGGNYHLQHNSPAIDAGEPRGARPYGPAPTIDIDGDPRPMGSGVDIGADEAGPFVTSGMVVDRSVALPGDRLNYTITLTSTSASENVSFWITDTLPSSTDYVPGSLHASGGTAVYLPAGGTLLVPHIFWTGILTSGTPIHLNFAVTVRSQTALHCTATVNVASVQTDTGGRDGRSTVEISATTQIGDGMLHFINIQDAADVTGDSVLTSTLQTGEALTVYAVGYDGCRMTALVPYDLGPISVTWRTSGTLESQEGAGYSFTFTPTRVGGRGTIVADDGHGHIGETGLITVVYAPPQITISPSFLSSTQSMNQHITQSLTISNGNALTLTYRILPTYSQSFELMYEWYEGSFIDSYRASSSTFWDYYFTPEQIEPLFVSGEVKVTEVEIQSGGINLAEWINWDLEMLLSNQDIDLPEGQVWGSRIFPDSEDDRDALCQFHLVIGERQDRSSYVYEANHNFVTGSTSVIPFYSRMHSVQCSPLQITDGLHAQLFLWTGDPRVTIQFDHLQLTVRGVVTYTMADWLTVAPISGTLGPSRDQTVQAVFDPLGQSEGVHINTIVIESNDPDDMVSIVPATMTVVPTAHLYLPLVMRNASPQ